MVSVPLDFNLSVEVDKFEVVIPNEVQTVQQMARAVRKDALNRVRRGVGAVGRLPRGKTGGAPLQDTGRLLDSISVVQSKRDPTLFMVMASGKRTDAATKIKTKRLRRRARNLRRQKRKALERSGLAEYLSGSELRRATRVTRAERGRTADTNAALLGILSTAPKDKRARAGGRGIYRVLESTPRNRKIAAKAARRHMKVELRRK